MNQTTTTSRHISGGQSPSRGRAARCKDSKRARRTWTYTSRRSGIFRSGQQSVTGVTAVEDSNSYWSIRGTSDTFCHRGTPVRCGQTIRLTHVNTGRNLHSHYFASPLSSNQEVSAFGDEGEGDHLDEWTVHCGESVWMREEAVRFRHKATDALLSVTGEQYGRPIHGQREVHAMSSPSQHSLWKAMEGIFMKPSENPAGSRDYSHPHTEF
ncbi:stromal cell-derived factor 2 isoform X2 [Larimichthys crocea]|uniref:stromal cell-derived factor 2 isoform X2 n=1 Tax=Larimichthys crocea TaxID=215358 RepID=UPI00054BC9F1|nr:stromal cell-derived factor 2 isoform X2 [Larimichthys crocea]